MARVTVEDCIDKTETRFELVMVAAQRARKLGTGAELLVDRDNDKNTVVSLREIAEEKVTIEDLKEELIRSRQRVIHTAEDDEELVDLLEEDFDFNAPDAGKDRFEDQQSQETPDPLDSSLSGLAGDK